MSTEEAKTQHYEGSLLVQPDEALPPVHSLLLGLQHLLAMDIYVVPFIVAGILSLSVQESAFLIQATFIASGLGTLIQSRFLMKLPVAQGPSYVPIGAIAGIALAHGTGIDSLAAVFGAILVGSLIVCVLGMTGIVRKAINYFVPPLVDYLRRRAVPHSHRLKRQYIYGSRCWYNYGKYHSGSRFRRCPYRLRYARLAHG